MNQFNRRDFIKSIAAASSASVLSIPLASCASIGGSRGPTRVVVVGGGYGGATAAKYVKVLDPKADVTLIEPNTTYTSCPLSNEVISGHREMSTLQVGYDGLKKRGVKVVHDYVTAIDSAKKTVTTKGGQTFAYDAAVVSPGIDFNFGAVKGYSEAASQIMPHAWKAGPQTLLLKKQLEAMPDGGKFIISVPKGPFRCPPGPYERAAQVANYCMHHGKKKSKIIILDANESFSKKGLFEQAWTALYGYGPEGMIEWVPGAKGGLVGNVDTATMTVKTEFDDFKGDVVNIIPPHTAGAIAKSTGLTNEKGWCPCKPESMESTLVADIYPIGDACTGGQMPDFAFPKSAHMAMSHAKVAAAAIVAKANGLPMPEPYYVNTCYSLVAPDYGFSVVHFYRVEQKDGKSNWVYIKEGSGVSPVNFDTKDGDTVVKKAVPKLFRKAEAEYADGWLRNVLADAFT